MSPARECSTSGDCADGKGERVRAPIELRATDAQRPRGATNAAAWHRSAACDVKLKRVDRILVQNYLCSGPDEPLWLPLSASGADHGADLLRLEAEQRAEEHARIPHRVDQDGHDEIAGLHVDDLVTGARLDEVAKMKRERARRRTAQTKPRAASGTHEASCMWCAENRAAETGVASQSGMNSASAGNMKPRYKTWNRRAMSSRDEAGGEWTCAHLFPPRRRDTRRDRAHGQRAQVVVLGIDHLRDDGFGLERARGYQVPARGRDSAPSTREDRGPRRERGVARAHWLTRSAQLNKKLET